MSDARHYSITRRLLLASLAILPFFLGITGYAIDQAHRHSLVVAEQDRLRLQFYAMLGAMEWDDGGINMDRLREPRYSQFRSGLYAAIGDTGGDLLWQSPSAATRSLPLFTGRLPQPGREMFDVTQSEDERFFRFRFHIVWEAEDGGEIPLTFSLLSSQATFLTELHSFRRQLTLWLCAAAAVLLVIQTAVLRWGLSPLRAMAVEIAELERGDREQLSQAYPEELTSVVQNLNRLLQKEKSQRERYRNTLADLAHSLKTPLSVLKSTLSGQSVKRELAHEQLQRMDSIIAYQLQRAVHAGPRHFGSRTQLAPSIERLLATMTKVYRDKEVHVLDTIDSGIKAAVDEDDLLELLGNLLDNAFKACRSTVQISALREGGHCVLVIEDDGPGIPEELAEKLVQRGQRGDQYGAGQGLGLAIARDIVDAYHGSVDFDTSDLGGARVVLTLPA